ncbi:tRNA (adenosine(37)-N6)-threonylcarbamoyltransferase complex transferase subunit TsaD [Fluviispira multicolorata]|uniref:tRNA N6-adenosine threonylcarbamoyltransferase n=1 Tax=Fluviispira multicolorata TaxID=2654512 RepID=A0A833N1A5_9BACT|nr:tRNA (adenosine(37)-N6)-threonylcarbamoyltransferase complex transferase subunit TsaD [Fluviispira multicolorata]KAB8030635.1 tRNA (adenosine(37)-N6)-threonylcarbamoyltransferase complex transferase subunit TsaD [Fluviispira multicolorata]
MQNTLLSIESSCDETAVSIIKVKKNAEGQIISLNILAHEVESQMESHAPFGGVVPEVAARDHLAKIYEIANKALQVSRLKKSDLSAIAVTMGPGLIGALMVGVLFARGLAMALNIPLISVNHVDAHLAPALLLKQFSPKDDLRAWHDVDTITYPALALTVSGGHCHLSLLNSPTDRTILGKSLDDACGEAFDKVAKLLGMSYPGGPLIEELAKQAEKSGNINEFTFPNKPANKENRYNFSYSGIKTSVMETIRKETGIKKGKITGKDLSKEKKQGIAYAFQNAALSQLLNRVENALQDYPEIKSVLVAGGVAQNKKFRALFSKLNKPTYFAPPSLCSDNATMIALQAALSENAEGFIQHPFAKYH